MRQLCVALIRFVRSHHTLDNANLFQSCNGIYANVGIGLYSIPTLNEQVKDSLEGQDDILTLAVYPQQ